MQDNYKSFYDNYWQNQFDFRKKTSYYEKRYDSFKSILLPEKKDYKVIDIGGGNGQFLKYLGIDKATIFDISDSGLKYAKLLGYSTVKGNLLQKFPIAKESFDVAYCFEVLEHLNSSKGILKEINVILKKKGILYVGQPNTPADGKHHVQRIYLKELVYDLKKSGFEIMQINLLPAFNRWEYPIPNLFKQKRIFNITKYLISFSLSKIPLNFRKMLAKSIPNRFALMYLIKCRKITSV